MRFLKRFKFNVLSIYGFFFFAFIYAPILLIVMFSFNANPVNMMIWDGFTLDWYRTIFGFSKKLTESALYLDSTDQLYDAVKNSLLIASTTTMIATVFGTAIALAVARFRFRLKGFYRALMFLPMIMPDIILGIALLIFFVNVKIELSVFTIVIGHCTFLISYVFIVVSARIADMDETLEEASADLGANGWQTFYRVTMPVILPGIVGGALLAFIISMDDLVITYFISGVDSTTLPVFIYGMLRRGIKPEINAIAAIILLSSMIIATVGLYIRSRKN
ncbi:ABC transporter permease [Oceanospirillaceae bacterium]|jgi:spermidine/putrescine transport system permease protein|nr:ABC transporter permease [Oceanospirillaceae bacterium]|tara:strand:- start:1249 stop:2079 length:831 start_codon:yes stop_codon:yes gene_type:complete